jgi:hypothetical protein
LFLLPKYKSSKAFLFPGSGGEVIKRPGIVRRNLLYQFPFVAVINYYAFGD